MVNDRQFVSLIIPNVIFPLGTYHNTTNRRARSHTHTLRVTVFKEAGPRVVKWSATSLPKRGVVGSTRSQYRCFQPDSVFKQPKSALG